MTVNSQVLRNIFLLLTLSITLVFGLHPKDFGREHTPSVNQAKELGFTKYSIATVDVNWVNASEIVSELAEFRLGVTLKFPVLPVHNDRFSIIFSINDTKGSSQILLGQWKNSLVLMSGEDYANQSNQPRITIPLDTVPGYAYPQELSVEIEATATSTSVTINEQMMERSNSYIIPMMLRGFTVSLGNSLNRKHGWLGSLSSFTLNYSDCSTSNANNNASVCKQIHTIDLQEHLKSSPSTMTPLVRYQDAQQSSSLILQSPYAMLDMDWLSIASIQHRNPSVDIKDVLVNFLGFIPVALAIFIVAVSRYQPASSALLTIFATFLLSLLIETVQVIIPSRTSSIVDIAVNVFAGASTATLCYAAIRSSRILGIDLLSNRAPETAAEKSAKES